MADNRFDGKPVSTSWDIVLTHARRMGVEFHLNSGRRTMRGQLALVREKGVWSPRNRHGAALPSPNAPHIRVGRQAHAIDVNGAAALVSYLRRQGLRPTRPVPGEPWHIEVPELRLRSYARKTLARQRKVGHA